MLNGSRVEIAAASGDLAGDRISADAERLTVSVENDCTAGAAAEEADPDDSPLSDGGASLAELEDGLVAMMRMG